MLFVQAVKYAQKHDVLLVHAAGNDGSDNDTGNNPHNPMYGINKASHKQTLITLNQRRAESGAASD